MLLPITDRNRKAKKSGGHKGAKSLIEDGFKKTIQADASIAS